METPRIYNNLQMVIQWFILLRWIACAGVLTTIISLQLIFRIPLPYSTLYSLTGLLFLANFLYHFYLWKIKRKVLTDREKRNFLHIQIISDYGILLALVFFTGFLENPMIYFLIFHIMLTSFLFDEMALKVYTAAIVLLLLILTILQSRAWIPFYPLNLSNETSWDQYYNNLSFRAAGMSLTLIISAYLIASIKKRIDYKGQQCEVELSRYKSLDKVKSNFILQVTHELRGPLAAVMGYHEILLKGLTGTLNGKTEEMLYKANRRTNNLLTMIGEMIDFAYMKSEKDVVFDDNRVKAADLINDNIALLKENAAKKNISFTVNCSPSIQLRTNRDLFNMILGNLLSNSIKYSRKGGNVAVTCSREKGELKLSVSDEGMGIPPDELEKVFEEFYRTREARSVERDGTGLGLAIVQRAVNSLNGSINVFSKPEEGTSFQIHLPVKNNKGG